MRSVGRKLTSFLVFFGAVRLYGFSCEEGIRRTNDCWGTDDC
jgi:hypothetical protein